MQSFVDLDRSFAPLRKEREADLGYESLWGRRIGGWLDWKQLLAQRRVVLLAEASSGKSSEFRNQADSLWKSGKAAFLIRIEELADQGFATALDPKVAVRFESWQTSSDEAWFFLDSIDEARVNRKSIESALKRFSRELGDALERAHVYISCRPSDWKTPEDRVLVERMLPAWETAQPIAVGDPDGALLDPIFKKSERTRVGKQTKEEPKSHTLLIVQLVPLSNGDCRKLAVALGVPDPDEFLLRVLQGSLDTFTERPGDVIDLIDYWKTHRQFASYAEMVEYGIERKLEERDAFRSDNDVLTSHSAREGAQRVAAALTLAKTFTLRAPGQEPDPSLSAGALEPSQVLPDWTVAQRNALLRRGIFIPSTYGRVRFHHRATQEYLTARWFDRLLQAHCPRREVWQLLFAERYGVSTVVPSLRPVAAWLALGHQDLLHEIIRREPGVLLSFGDPSSIPIRAKVQLIEACATRKMNCDISGPIIDRKLTGLFSEPGLAEVIRKTWISGADIRLDLLAFIRDGAIKECLDLARSATADQNEHYGSRIVALEALKACGDEEGLSAAADALMASYPNEENRLISAYVKELYPRHLTTERLLTLIETEKADSSDSSLGLSDSLEELYEAAADSQGRSQIIARVGQLCLSQPFVESYHRVSAKYVELAKHVGSLTVRVLRRGIEHEPSDDVVRLLMIAERALEDRSDDDRRELRALVNCNLEVKRALFWADVVEVRNNARRAEEPTRVWHLHLTNGSLWTFDQSDLPWLHNDVAERLEADARIAFSAIAAILRGVDRLNHEADRLRQLAEGRMSLTEDLNEYLRTHEESQEEKEERRTRDASIIRRAEEERAAKESWVRLREELRANPKQLSDAQRLARWGNGVGRLKALTDWLHRRTGSEDRGSPVPWRLLKEGFGRDVAEAYRDGVKLLWRLCKPERPKHAEGGPITTKWTTILSVGGIAVEASEDPDWAFKLTPDDAKRAALHGCLSEQGFPEWIEALVEAHPDVVLPVLDRCLRVEWFAPKLGPGDFIQHYAVRAALIPEAIQRLLFKRIAGGEPLDLDKLDNGLRILNKLDLTVEQKHKLVRVARSRIQRHLAEGRTELVLRALAMVFVLVPDEGLTDLESWFAAADTNGRDTRVGQTLGYLFSREDVSVASALDRATVANLARLLELAYLSIRPEQDIYHTGVYSRGPRDIAEAGRNAILTALVERTGEDAYRALRRASELPQLSSRAVRFSELARSKAEKDSELLAWTPAEVLNLEGHHTAPVKTGADLMRLVMGLLQDIQLHLDKGDATSRALLRRAQDEEEVQKWLVEQLSFRSQGRFTTYREAEVADHNKPDVIVSSTSGQAEVAIEVKHGGKRWTLRQLRNALTTQLAVDYLKTKIRRHGILVVTRHSARIWLDPELNIKLSFDSVISGLSQVASTIIENEQGAVEVAVMGLDAT